MYWKYVSPYIPSTINFYNNAQPLYIEKILFTLCQFQERRHNEVLSRISTPASATSCRRASGNSCFLLGLDVSFVVLVLWVFVHDKDNIYWALQERDGGFMDTSEKWECYVFGQCEVGFNTHMAGLGSKLSSGCINHGENLCFLALWRCRDAIFTSYWGNMGKAF